MANELYLVTWGVHGARHRVVISAKSEDHLRNVYSWHGDSHIENIEIKCIGIALPGEPAGIICASVQDEDEDPRRL